MQQLFRFIYRNRSLFTFLLLLSVGLMVLVRTDPYHSAAWFRSSNRASGFLMSQTQSVQDYLYLVRTNEQLAAENSRLREQISNQPRWGYNAGATTSQRNLPESLPGQYSYLPAKVINNSWRFFNNFITINKGARDGVEVGMGVIGPNGVVGQVAAVSEHYATLISLLHTDFMVSSLVERTGNFATTNWQGPDPQLAAVQYIPRHVEVLPGDTVVTSGYNSVFPSGMLIGTVTEAHESEEASFLEVSVQLSTDFQSLSFVYLVRNSYRQEIDSLMEQTRTNL